MVVFKRFWGKMQRIIERDGRLNGLYEERQKLVNGVLYKLNPKEYRDNSEIGRYAERLAEIDREISRYR